MRGGGETFGPSSRAWQVTPLSRFASSRSGRPCEDSEPGWVEPWGGGSLRSTCGSEATHREGGENLPTSR